MMSQWKTKTTWTIQAAMVKNRTLPTKDRSRYPIETYTQIFRKWREGSPNRGKSLGSTNDIKLICFMEMWQCLGVDVMHRLGTHNRSNSLGL